MKPVLLLAVFILGTLVFPSRVSASLVVVQPDGGVLISVLGEKVTLDIPQNEEVKVTKSLAYEPGSKAQISLKKEENAIYLNVSNEKGENTLEVTDIKDNVIEIEERPQVEKIAISIADNKFTLEQNGLKASTDYEITIDSENARVLLDAPSGKHYLSISPKEATQTLLRAKTLSTFNYSRGISIIENDNILAYKIEGEKLLNFFNVYYHPIPVTAYVSAVTGEITNIDQPQWLQILGFLFV